MPAGEALFTDERADLIEILILSAWGVAAVDVAHDALAIEDDGVRHALHLIQLTDLAVDIEENREGHRCGLEPIGRKCGIRFHVDADQRHALVAVLVVKLLKNGHLLPTGAAPAGPEIYQHDLSFQIGEAYRLAAVRIEFEC